MAFGSFLVEDRPPRPEREQRQTKPHVPDAEKTKVTPEPLAADHERLQILLIGRNLPVLQEFLCSMSQNMSEALQKQGFAFYTQELECISDVIAQKKRMEQFCWSFTNENWTYPDCEETSRTYIFCISPSGDQERALELVFRCITPDSEERMKWSQTDAVWLLSDGALFFDPGDGFLAYLQEVLLSFPEQSAEDHKPVCLIQSQIEHLGHFDGPGDRSILPRQTADRICGLCRDHFSADTPAALIPVQVYGGMECVGMDARGAPVLHIGKSGFYQSYIPDNCHVPALYTIQSICARSRGDYFANASGKGLLQAIRSHFAGKFGDPQWKPDLLCCEEDV